MFTNPYAEMHAEDEKAQEAERKRAAREAAVAQPGGVMPDDPDMKVGMGCEVAGGERSQSEKQGLGA